MGIRRARARSAALLSLPALVAAGLTTATTTPASAVEDVRITVLSSAADQVTGGDARIRVEVPRGMVRVTVDGRDVTASLGEKSGRVLEGVVTGLPLGRSTIAAEPKGKGRGLPGGTRITVVNHPISGPVFSGDHQAPFVCKTERPRNGLGQPLPDPGAAAGYAVFATDASGAKTTQVVGHSTTCSAPTVVEHRYRSTDRSWKRLPADGSRPADMATTTLLDGRTVDYVVRYERGVINRFVYSIAMLAPLGEDLAAPSTELWNGRLTYSFDGGVAIGHSQGELDEGNSFHESLGKGYAVVASTGTRTSVHYDLVVGGETALMVKERFVERYGLPLYTVGVGGSGGGIQQYVYGQNHPGLLDAGVPQYSYPDMVTQTIHVGDCELLEHYMDVVDRTNPKWSDVANRQALQGMHATTSPNLSSGDRARWTQVLGATSQLGYRDWQPQLAKGELPLGECRQGWFGLLPLAMNPLYGTAGAGSEHMRPLGVMDTVHWTHWEDAKNVYGVGDDGYARQTWDNVGVQYGLQALEQGVLTPQEFLDLNAKIGGWKDGADMVQEGAPFLGPVTPATWDPWSRRNMLATGQSGIAPRSEGSVAAMQAAYASGLVFDGDVDIPLIDWRHYREEDLDMHNSHQSFASRQRMLDHDGDASNMVVWSTDGRPSRLSDQTMEAFAVLDQWMANRRANPGATAAQTKPALAVDRCFTATGQEIARGDDVWDGILDDEPAGACTAAFPTYTTSRIQAGGPIRGGVYKCALQSVEQAVAAGLYGSWRPDAAQTARLEAVFPSGVCDYSKPDVGRPTG